jgi:uracil permease
MPAVVIGPTVAIIGLCLAGNAVTDSVGGIAIIDNVRTMDAHGIICLVIALITLAVVMLCSVYGKKMMKLVPFVLGILAGYIVAAIFTAIGSAANIEAMKIIDFSGFTHISWVPDFSFLTAAKGFKDLNGTYIGTILVAYAPVAFVVFAEHLADHKNLSSIVGVNLLEEPGLTMTLLGDGIGSIVGTFFGGCPNTTYGESIATVAITRNASTVSIWGAAFACIIFSLISPLVAFLETIPTCVMGGVCVALYGFIAVSGFKMLQSVDLNKNRNLFVASIIFITGVGGLVVTFGAVEIRTVACALILGILANVMLSKEKEEEPGEDD